MTKCGYHLIYFDFDSSGLPKMRYTPKDDSVSLTNQDGKEITIKAKNTFTPRKNLGHYKAPEGNSNTEYEERRKKAKEITKSIIACGCNRTENRMLYNTVWRPVVEYTLPQSFLSEKQLKQIEKENMPSI